MAKKSDYSRSIDLWALGVLTYEFLTGVAPFEDSLVMTQRRIAENDMTPLPESLSAEAKDFVHSVWRALRCDFHASCTLTMPPVACSRSIKTATLGQGPGASVDRQTLRKPSWATVTQVWPPSNQGTACTTAPRGPVSTESVGKLPTFRPPTRLPGQAPAITMQRSATLSCRARRASFSTCV